MARTTYTFYGSNAEQFLALSQGKADVIVQATAIFGGYIKGPGAGRIRICSTMASAPADWTVLMVPRSEQGTLNRVNHFVWHHWKNGRTNELTTPGSAEMCPTWPSLAFKVTELLRKALRPASPWAGPGTPKRPLRTDSCWTKGFNAAWRSSISKIW